MRLDVYQLRLAMAQRGIRTYKRLLELANQQEYCKPRLLEPTFREWVRPTGRSEPRLAQGLAIAQVLGVDPLRLYGVGTSNDDRGKCDE